MNSITKCLLYNFSFILLPFTACISKDNKSLQGAISSTDTIITATDTSDNNNFSDYIGNYRSVCDLDTNVHLMRLSVAKKEGAIIISYQYPDKHLVLKGEVVRDTINFDPKFNVWTINDKNGTIYGFLFEKEDGQPNVRLLNEDSKAIFESSKCAIGKEIIFKKGA